eukprot:10862058-Heterocapsa_arctica.AAC.1
MASLGADPNRSAGRPRSASCAASTCEPIASFARVSLGNSSCAKEGFLAGLTANSLRNSWLP